MDRDTSGSADSLSPRRSEATIAPAGLVEVDNLHAAHALNGLNQQLRNTISNVDADFLILICVMQHYFDLAPVIRVDNPRHNDDPSVESQTATRPYESDKAHRN